MATYFLDYEGGSDAADGTTFANRWKTLQNGATAARIAPGDVIRIMGSPAPTSLGISATWTNKSATVSLASALNALITNCDSAWTASPNVTCTANTVTYRTSTGSASASIAAGFTTGKVAYFGLGGAQDYSAYQGITFWLQVGTSALAASTLEIHLCSDTTGDTPVDTFAIPAVSQTAQWIPIYIDKGSALGNSIQSIALHAVADPGTIVVLLDNISTVKAVGNDNLNLCSLISKNTTDEYWWALRSINGTTLGLDAAPSMAASAAAKGYYGTTESVTTYKRETIKTDLVSGTTTAVQFAQEDGSAGNLITYSGGWDRTDMSTQTLETWFDGQSGNGEGIDSNGKDYVYFDNIYCVRYTRGWDFSAGGTLPQVGVIGGAHCNTSGVWLSNVLNGFIGNEIHIWSCNSQGFETGSISDVDITLLRMVSPGAGTVASGWAPVLSNGRISITTLEVYHSNWNGVALTTGEFLAGFKIGAMIAKECAQAGLWVNTLVQRFECGSLDTDACGAGLNFSGARGDLLFGELTLLNGTGYGVNGGVNTSVSTGADITIQSLTTSGNTSGAMVVGSIYGKCRVLKSSMAESTKVALASGTYGSGSLSFRNFNGTANDHRTWYGSGGTGDGQINLKAETSVRHTASGLAWKVTFNSAFFFKSSFPLSIPLGKVAVLASQATTFKIWMRRTHTGVTGILRCRGGQIDGVAADVTDSIGAAIDTWEEQSITFTPDETGVVEIDLLVYSSEVSQSLYFDDITVS